MVDFVLLKKSQRSDSRIAELIMAICDDTYIDSLGSNQVTMTNAGLGGLWLLSVYLLHSNYLNGLMMCLMCKICKRCGAVRLTFSGCLETGSEYP